MATKNLNYTDEKWLNTEQWKTLCEFKLKTETGKEFQKNTIYTKNENVYALIEEHLVMSILECDHVMVELDVK